MFILKLFPSAAFHWLRNIFIYIMVVHAFAVSEYMPQLIATEGNSGNLDFFEELMHKMYFVRYDAFNDFQTKPLPLKSILVGEQCLW